ncbi:MAG: PLD nuclease N-terminal domain-containing protein [Propionibacteriaceae bacterium]|nr:PLD nuclease N-terminal domain-containing protein [Propionibacteriaceae bacterium]
MTDQIRALMPLIIPLAVIEIGLLIASVIHILTHKQYRMGNRALWLIISIVITTIGPILYFILGRSDEEDDDE